MTKWRADWVPTVGQLKTTTKMALFQILQDATSSSLQVNITKAFQDGARPSTPVDQRTATAMAARLLKDYSAAVLEFLEVMPVTRHSPNALVPLT